jgi:hypothetical protein
MATVDQFFDNDSSEPSHILWRIDLTSKNSRSYKS